MVGIQKSFSQPPKLVDPTNLPIFNKCVSVSPFGDNWWKCDSLMVGQLFTTLKPHTGLGFHDSMAVVKIWTDSFVHQTHYKYQQYFKGILVEAAVYLEQTYGGNVLSSNGNICENLDYSSNIEVTESTALTSALNHVDADMYAWEDDSLDYFLKHDSIGTDTTYYPKGQLVWALIGDSIYPANYKLAWKFDIYATLPYYYSDVYIDAQTGEFLTEKNRIDYAIGDFNHFMYGVKSIDTREYNGKPRLWTSTGGFRVKTKDNNWNKSWALSSLPKHDNNSWGNSHWAATSSHWAATESWRLWQWKYKRTGCDDNGKEIRIWANASDPDNPGTFFKKLNDGKGYDEIHVKSDGSANEFDILEASIEVLGHEYAHGVNFYTGNLGSESGEAAALNESYADIFGLMADRHFWGTMRNWKLGDEFSSNDGVRDFEDPTNFTTPCMGSQQNYPKSYKDANWFPFNDKNCGGHINCSVQNRCFFLLANGGTQLGITVTGIGIDKAELIAQFAFTNFMSAKTNYPLNREQWVKAAIKLFGACSFEVVQTCRAWKACGIGEFCPCDIPCNPCKCVSPIYDYPEDAPNSESSVKESKSPLNKILVYPNPSSDKFQINFNELTFSEIQSIQSIEIIDIYGKNVKSISLPEKQIIIISLIDLPNGIYSINIQSSNFVKALRIVKQ